jgi:short-subunit dehydrogenase
MNYLLIIGASNGIGKKIAELLSTEGWKVINISKRTLSLLDMVNYIVDFFDFG